jgi:hypothetical protein
MKKFEKDLLIIVLLGIVVSAAAGAYFWFNREAPLPSDLREATDLVQLFLGAASNGGLGNAREMLDPALRESSLSVRGKTIVGEATGFELSSREPLGDPPVAVGLVRVGGTKEGLGYVGGEQVPCTVRMKRADDGTLTISDILVDGESLFDPVTP